jgi:glutamate-ammonia-ligase adenylyltransferase
LHLDLKQADRQGPQMTQGLLSQRIAQSPIAFDAVQGANAAGPFADLSAAAQGLIAGAAGCAPYLAELIRLDPDFTRQCFLVSPEQLIDQIIDDVLQPSKTSAAHLRRAKRSAALLIALCDLGGVWNVTQVTGALSAFADACISAALDHLVARAIEASKIVSGAGLFVLGLGKLGAHELNYSSDVDLVAFFDPELFIALGSKSATERGVEIIQAMARLLQDITGDGYVFRVDLRLRPDPGAMPVALSINAAETYYAGRGQVWERAAFIKARTVAGDMAAGNIFLQRLRPFVFRKSLDYAAIEEIHDIKRRLNAHAGHGEIAVLGHDIKIGRGGIREIEFFAQGQQLIAGGREPRLTALRTLQALAALADLGMIQSRTCRDLIDAYVFLRNVEHRLQMVADEQTQKLPRTQEGLDRIARFSGFALTSGFVDQLLGHLRRVAAHYDHLFADDAATPTLFAQGEGQSLTTTDLDHLRTLGFSDANSAAHILRNWLSGRAPCLHDARARAKLANVLPDLLQAIGASDDPAGALARFDDFLSRLPAGLQLFHLLQANPRLITLLVEVLGNAPRLARLLAQEAECFDAVIAPGFFEFLPNLKSLIRTARHVKNADGLHRFVREGRLRVGLQILTGRAGALEAGPFLADLAIFAVQHCLSEVQAAFESRFGIIPNGHFAVIAMGRLGGREMTVSSDLDMIFVYEGDQASTGPDSLDPSTYYGRLGQNLIAALTAATAEGHLFQIDMRLRPSGNKGPLAVTYDALARYYAQDAWTYEHMALTRGRAIAGSPAFIEQVDGLIREIVNQKRDPIKLSADIISMRARLTEARPAKHFWQLKETPGGLIDIEFAAQKLVLAHGADHQSLWSNSTLDILTRAGDLGLIPLDQAANLKHALILQLDLQQVLRIALDHDVDPGHIPSGLARVLARTGQCPTLEVLGAQLQEVQAQTAAFTAEILAQGGE